MASTKAYLDFILEQLSEPDEISYRAMMGEYVLYYRKQRGKRNDHVILDASLPAKQIYLKRGYVATKYNMIETENEDYLCFDVMEKHL